MASEFDAADWRQALSLIQLLSLEIASELQLHYESDEFFALSATIENIKQARDFMKEHDVDVPDSVNEVISMYYSTQN